MDSQLLSHSYHQGWMGFSAEDPLALDDRSVTVAGYPNNTPVMKKSEGQITLRTNDFIIRYTASTLGGMSGAPCFTADQYVRAINAGPGDFLYQSNGINYYSNNRGIVITSEMFYLLRAEKADGLS